MEIVIKRANVKAAIAALEKAFPGKPWSELVQGSVVVEGRGVIERVAKALAPVAKAYDPSQPRDQAGKWTEGGGSLTVYHGSPHKFSAFDLSRAGSTTDAGLLGHGIYLSTDKRVSEKYPHQYEVDASLKKPLLLKMPDWHTDKQDLITSALGLPLAASSKEITRAAVARGHDGVILDYSPAGYHHKEVVAFNPSQLKVISREASRVKKWEESDHPRAPAGQSTGGQFVAAGAGTAHGAVSMKQGLQIIHDKVQGSNGALHATLKVTTHDNKNHYFKAPTATEAHDKFYFHGPVGDVKSLTFGTSHAKSKPHTGSPVLGFKAHGVLASEDDLNAYPGDVKPRDQEQEPPAEGKPIHQQLGLPAPSPKAVYDSIHAAEATLDTLHEDSKGKTFPAIQLDYPNKTKYITSFDVQNAIQSAKDNHAAQLGAPLVNAKVGLVPRSIKDFSQSSLAQNFIDYGHVADPNKVFGSEEKPVEQNKTREESEVEQNKTWEESKQAAENWGFPEPPHPKDQQKDTLTEMMNVVDAVKEHAPKANGVTFKVSYDSGGYSYFSGSNAKEAAAVFGSSMKGWNKDHLEGLKVGLYHEFADNFVPYASATQKNLAELKDFYSLANSFPDDHLEHPAKFTTSQDEALSSYRANGYVSINKLLAGTLDDHYKGSTLEDFARAYAAHLDDAMEKSHTNKDLDLFRGAKVTHLPPDFKVGTTFNPPAFSSASLSRRKAGAFDRGVMMHIHVPKGTRALPGTDKEKEIILPRNGQFTVTKIEKSGQNAHRDVWVDFKDTHDNTWYHNAAPKQKKVAESAPMTLAEATSEPVSGVTKADKQPNRFVWTQDELENMLADAKRRQIEKRIRQLRAQLAKWEESQHPRVGAGSPEGGQFTSGSGGSTGSSGALASAGGTDRTGSLKDGAFHISDKDKADITHMIERGAAPEEISKHPAIIAAKAHAEALPETHKQPGYGTPAWRADREFNDVIRGYKAATDALITKALSYSKHGPVRQDKEATILIGPPASGKSYFGEQIAAKHHAAIVDPDDAKKMFKEYRGGIGANAVHEESGVLAGAVQARLMASGTNMVFPKVGKSRESIQTLTKTLKTLGYRVNLVNMDVHQDEAFKRSTKRFLQTGRMISHDYTRSVDGNPTKTYNAIKDNGDYAQTVNIDANGKPGRHLITEGAHTSIGRSLLPK